MTRYSPDPATRVRRLAAPRTVTGKVLLAGILAIAAGLFLAYVPAHRGFFDVGVYHGAVSYWLHDGGQLYDYLSPGTKYGFTYPPFAALVMSPLALLAWHPAIAVSIAVNVVAAGLTLYWLLDPIARREGWNRWFAFAVAACVVAVFEPVRDTVSFGQVNLLLLLLVMVDVKLQGRSRLFGVGIGLASAIKLTPAVFILYLVVTGRWRAAATAAGTAAGATLLAAAVAPQASRVFWTEALWDTGRIGDLAYVSNQSLQGVLARIDPHLTRLFWVAAVLAVLVVWAVRVRRAARVGDHLTGMALTAVVGCLISPITWVHHLVWLLPALAVLGDAGLRQRPGPRRIRILAAFAGGYVLLCSSIVWLWWADPSGIDGLLGGNTYVWISLALLVGLPIRTDALREVDQREPVAVHAQAADDARGDSRDDRVVPELLAGMDVGDVHLDEGAAQEGTGVPHRVRIM
jgi:alpha-1,2-mannosyltransferase